ncbi:MAG TPA: hypothetical protein VD838_01880, partial [Anaeromyxobacteraceae bacterium]|nr:hypothetical protein [Anaeromyxobacteraceae bacterium]
MKQAARHAAPRLEGELAAHLDALLEALHPDDELVQLAGDVGHRRPGLGGARCRQDQRRRRAPHAYSRSPRVGGRSRYEPRLAPNE